MVKLKSRISWQLYVKLKVKNNWIQQEFMNESGEIKNKNQLRHFTTKKKLLTIFDLKRMINGKIANILIEKNKSTKKRYNIL